MILERLISPVALNGSRAQKLKSAAVWSFVAAANGWAANYGFSQGHTGNTVLAIGNAAAMAATTFTGTYTLLSAMEPDIYLE